MRKLLIIPFFLIVSFGFSKKSQSQWQLVNKDYGTNCSASIGSKLFINSLRGLLVSNDSGSSWSVALPMSVSSSDSAVNSITSIGNRLLAEADMGLLLSVDSGKTWGIISTQIIGIFRIGSNIYGEMTSGLFRSTDSGKTWINVNLIENVLGLTAIGTTIFAGTLNNGVFRSTDDGLSWKNSLQNSHGTYWHLAVSGNKIFAVGTPWDTAFLSADTGNTWQKLYFLTGSACSSLAIYGSNIFASNDDVMGGGVFLSTDTAKTWSRILFKTGTGLVFIFGDYIFAASDGLYRASLSDFGIDAVHTPLSANNSKFTLLSNPVASTADFQFDALEAPEQVEVFDALGRPAMTAMIPAGSTNYRADVSQLAAGVYIARFGVNIMRFIKE